VNGVLQKLRRAHNALRGETPATLALAARHVVPQLRSMSERDALSSLLTLRRFTPDRIARAYRDDTADYYVGDFIGAGAIGAYASSEQVHDAAEAITSRLTADAYASYVKRFTDHCRTFAGTRWVYADIVSAVYAASDLLQPQSYLEIGVRRGRSMAVVGATRPDCSIVGVDMWISDYAGLDNPGPDLVRDELRTVGHHGPVELLSANSHMAVPALLLEQPDLTFDLINVDGDHTAGGAGRDLLDVLPRLRIGGALIFDDIAHPSHPWLRDVWRRSVVKNRRFSTWEFGDLGFGVGIAVRRW